MEIAGRGAAIRALRMWQENPGEVVIVVGRGNNGGDGLVVARYLTLWGVPVSVWLVAQARQEGETSGKRSAAVKTKSLAAGQSASTLVRDESDTAASMRTRESVTNKTILEGLNVEVRLLEPEALCDAEKLHQHGEHDSGSDPHVDELFDRASLVVDALFGTGLSQPVEGLYKRVIDSINRSGKRVLALDLPSGINSDTGQVMGTAVRADQTVTFGYLKPGLLTHPGATLAGQIGIVDIGLPELPESKPDINLMTVEIAREILPLRPTDAHKGSFGHVLAIAGSVGMAGAAMLASISSLRIGCGMTFLATPRSVLAGLPAEEVIYRPMPETESGTLSKDAFDLLKTQMATAQAVILGPGLGLNDDTVELTGKVLNDISCPCIIDADGLNAIARRKEVLTDNEGDFVLTPHPKELARLLNCEVSEVQADRINYAIKAARKFNAVVVLKGAMTVTASPDGEVFINPTGNPGMATAGAGDVLSGIIGGLLAQNVDPFQAAAAGAYIHGRAGDVLAQEIDESGIIAGDLKRVIPFAVESIRAGERSDLENMFLTDGSD